MLVKHTILIPVTAVVLAGASWAQHVRCETRINTAGSNPDSLIAGITVDEDPTSPGSFVMVWAEQLGTSGLTQDIYASRSDDDGLRFAHN